MRGPAAATTGRRQRASFAHAADRHAGVRRFEDHAHAAGVEFAHQQVRDLLGHLLLHLRPARQRFDHARNLAQPDDLAVRQVGHVRLADERQQVVFAHRREIDVLHEHHLVVLLGERPPQRLARVLAQAGEHLGVHAGDAGRRFDEALALRVLADGQ